MQSLHCLHGLSCGLAFVVIAGCQSYGPYGPYGASPGYYMPPAGSMGPAPGGAYGAPPAGSYGVPPGGSYVNPSPTPVDPNLGPSTSFPADEGDHWRQADGTNPPPANNAPSVNSSGKPYEPSGSGGMFDDIDSSRSVPNYSDPVDPPTSSPRDFRSSSSAPRIKPGNSQPETPPSSGFGAEPDFGGSSPAGAPATGSPQRPPRSNNRRSFESDDEPFSPDDNAQPIEPFGAAGSGEDFDPAADQFQAPFQPASQSRATPTTAARPNPYAYDRQQYSWLRGVVNFDEQSGTWNLIYSLQPDADDDFGGSVDLVNDPKLSVLKPNDVVLVEGQFDAQRQTARGKPMYRVQHLARLVPK